MPRKKKEEPELTQEEIEELEMVKRIWEQKMKHKIG